MSHYDYEMSLKISAQDPPFYALIMACFRKADTDNQWKLRSAFPAAWAEFEERYHSPGGLLETERHQAMWKVHKHLFGPKEEYETPSN